MAAIVPRDGTGVLSFGPLISVQAYISELAHGPVVALAPSELVPSCGDGAGAAGTCYTRPGIGCPGWSMPSLGSFPRSRSAS